MAKRLIYSILILLLLSALAAGAIYFYSSSIHWKSLAATESPNGELSVKSHAYGSDGNRHAPYGTYIFLNQKYEFSNPKGHVIFAGYCENEPKFYWLSDSQLAIKCKLQKEHIRTLASKAYGVSIVFEAE